MSFLYKHLRIHQVFGANTDVGKTVLTTALVRSSARSIPSNTHKPVYYLKPVSTGPPDAADDSIQTLTVLAESSHVLRYSGLWRHAINASSLFKLGDPVSPHLAALREAKDSASATDYSQNEFLRRVEEHIRQTASKLDSPSSMYIETAGGVHSPTLSGLPQIDAYRPLFLPTILVGDSRLGGISSTISAYESLMLRGYPIDAILLFREEYYRNWEYLTDYFKPRGISVTAIRKPPSRQFNGEEDTRLTESYYRDICGEDGGAGDTELRSVVEHLERRHLERLEELASMPQRTLDSIWWPFEQHAIVNGPKDVTVVDSAYGDFLHAFQAPTSDTASMADAVPSLNPVLEPRYDGSASWWTQSVGHGHPELALAAARAAGRYGHVIFPLATHEPALVLAERLLKDGPGKGWADKVFYSDNGSTGTEVGLKMALRSAALRYPRRDETSPKKDLGVIGIRGSYHGDTIGAMDASEGGVYNSSVEWHHERGFWFEPPRVGVQDGKVVISSPSTEWKAAYNSLPNLEGVECSDSELRYEFPSENGLLALHDIYDVESRFGSSLARLYEKHITSTLERLVRQEGRAFGVLLLEPLVMGAAGMVFVDPLFQRILIDVVRSREDLWAEALDCETPSIKSPSLSSHALSPLSERENWRGLPVMFDEVFVGLYRLGVLTSSSILRTTPDISVFAKILTGGVLPLSVTLASQSIFNAFLGDQKVDALLHGHSYTAHPVGCAVANRSFELMEEIVAGSEWKTAKSRWDSASDQSREISSPSTGSISTSPGVWSLWDPTFVLNTSQYSVVEDVMTLGTVLAIRLRDDAAGYQAGSARTFMNRVKARLRSSELRPFGLHFRTLGNVAYLMSSLNTPGTVLRDLETGILAALENQ